MSEIPGKIPSQEGLVLPEYKGRIVEFEGVKIQWEKGQWEFHHPELGVVTKPTYPLLNPKYWAEIADLLSQGETAAGMMMGVYGVFKKLDRKDAKSADALFDNVKKRPRSQNFVALVHPKDITGFVDRKRLQEPYGKQFRHKEGRIKFYAGPQHVILPVKENKVNPALVQKDDKTIACFWVPGHYGFEGIVDKARKKIRRGLLGGGSLNIHGKEPYYDKNSLREAMAQQKEWLEEIDFIIFDDIAETGDIGRSHTMIKYLEERPEIIRIGSLSIDTIRKRTGHDIQLSQEVRFASSKIPYSDENNLIVNERVIQVLQRTQRFNSFLQGLSARKLLL